MLKSVWIKSSPEIKRCLPAVLFCLLFLFFSCSAKIKSIHEIENDDISEYTAELIEEKIDETLITRLSDALANSKLPRDLFGEINNNIFYNSDFISELQMILFQDRYLWILVDKEHPLGENYEPDDLVVLKGGLYVLNNTEVLMLRRAASDSLDEMAAAAGSEGVTLLVSYAYRLYTRQIQSYTLHLRNVGQREADRVSARPGYSQHQLGLTIDFDSVTNVFAGTKQGIWLNKNASRFGWSLSYPHGYEGVTGYSWESWHYRYVGTELAAFIDKYFNGIQQYALRFIHEFTSL